MALLATFTPRRCGIATFAADLASAITDARDTISVDVLAMNDGSYDYPDDVVFEVDSQDPTSFTRAAEFLNRGGYDVLSVQHEYGIFGGVAGENLLELMRCVEIPIVTTLHTVLKEPTDDQRRVMGEVLKLSQRIVVMSFSAITTLATVHGVDVSKIDYIPHGVPEIPISAGASLRKEIGVDGPLLLTFGFLSPDKGIQSVIEAMPSILEQFPTAVYYVVGATHPHERAHRGESYRDALQLLARTLRVEDHVVFVNEFVPIEQLKAYLSAADCYLTPYLNPVQSTSGTLAYAMAAGKVIVSTPYNYAEELLSEGRGILVPFASPDAIAAAINDVMRDPLQRKQMSMAALEFGRVMGWDAVGTMYVRVMEAVMDRTSRVVSPTIEHVIQGAQSEICLDHLIKLTDDTGVLQHATYSVPNRNEGYCLDDNARALLLTVLFENGGHRTETVDRLQATYLSFLAHAFNPETHLFRNFMSYQREWLESSGSEDSHGRALWCLGYTIAHVQDSSHAKLAEMLMQRGMPAALNMRSPRACAYAMLGAAHYLEVRPNSQVALRLVQKLGHYIHDLFVDSSSPEWIWLESRLGYANARISQALMVAGQILGEENMILTGFESLTWLLKHQTSRNGYFSPVGSEGAGPLELGSVQFDQQPVEVWSTMSACLTAAKIDNSARFHMLAERCFEWFHGYNAGGALVANPVTGACFDGLERWGVNQNQGAESTISYLCSTLELNQALTYPKSVFERAMRISS